LWFWSNDRGIFFDLPDDPPSTHDRMRGMRVRVDTDSADAVGGINQLYFVFSQGVRGLGATQNGQELASRANGRVDFSKMELTVSRLAPLPLGTGFSALVAAYGQFAFTPNCAAMAGACSAAVSIPPSSSRIPASKRCSSSDTIFPFNSRHLPRRSSTASSTMAGSTILPRFRAHLPAWMQPPLEAGYAWDGSML
jgi:hypothetical protein